MKKHYFYSDKNIALFSKLSKVFRLLMVVFGITSLMQRIQIKSLGFSALFYIIFLLNGSVSWGQISLSGGSIATGVSTNTTTSTTLTIPKPSGLAVGDIMIVQVVQSGNNNTTAIGDATGLGWTEIAGSNIRTGFGNYSRATLLYKIATSTDVAATNFSFTLDGNSDDGEGGITAFTGVDNTNPFDVTPGTIYTNIATDQTLNATAITTTTANSAIIMFGALYDNVNLSAWTTTNPGNLTELYDVAFNATEDIGMGAAWATKPTIGATGTGSAAISGGNNVNNGSILIALRPCTANPTITTSGTATSVCFSTSAQTTTLPYTATTNSPTSYSIDWNAAANAAGLVDQTSTTYTFLSGAGNMPSIAIPASLASATYNGTLTIRTSGGCRNTQAISVTVNPINTVGAASSTPTICIGSALPAAITHTTTGATGIGTPTGLPAGVTATWALNTITINGTPTASGTFNYSIPLTGGCGSVSATGTITVSRQPTAAAGGTQTICSNGTATVSGASSSNGTIVWTENGAGSITAGATTLTPTYTAAAGDAGNTVTLTMTVTNSPCTAATAIYSVVVSPNNTVSAALVTPNLCVNTPLAAVITHTTTGATGIGAATGLPAGVTASWASGNITISGTPTASGTFNYSIPLTGGCGSVNALGTITVNPNNTVGTASATPTLCINTALPSAITHTTAGATGIGTPINLPSGVSASLSANTITISGTPSASGTFNYSIPLAGGCGTVLNATGTITVQDPVVAAGTINGTATVCQGQTGIAYSVPTIANATGYTWTLPSGATIASGNNTNSITVNFAANASSGNVVVYGTNTCGNGVSASFPVTVNTISTAPTGISGTTTICNGDSTILTVTGGIIGVGASAEWFIGSCNGTSAGTGNSITVSPSTTTTYYVRYGGTCNTTSCTSVTVTVNTLSVAPIGITGISTICQGTSTTLSVSGGLAGTAAVAQWFTGSCGGTSAGTGNSLTVSPITTTTYYVRYSGTCNTTACASINVIVDPLPLPAGGITGLPTVCQGQNGVAYSVGAITNATSYTWTLPSGAAIASGANTNSITVDYATTATAGNITVRGTNSCGDGVISVFPVAVNSLPTAAGVITGSATVCQGQNGVVYSIPAIANAATYSWTLPSGALITAGANTNSITVNYSVTATSGDFTVYGINPCGNGVSANRAITVNPLPIAAGVISGTATVCQGQNGVVYSVPTITNATGYAWVLPTGVTIASGTNTNSITVNFSTTAISGNVTVNGTNACGSGITADFPVTVNPLPAAAGIITGTTPVCQGQNNVVYSVPAIANATTYIWTLPSGASISAGAGTNSIMVDYDITAVSGNITVKGNNACGNGVISANYPVTVNITPYIPNNYSPIACSGLGVSVTPASGGGNIVPLGTTYSWGLPTVTGGITGATALSGQTTFNQTLVNPTNTIHTASYSVTATTGGCSATTFSVLVTVYPKPTVSGTPLTQSICSGAAISVINFSNPNGITGTIDYNWTRDNTTNVTGMATSGSGAITGNLSNATNSVQITVFTVIATTQHGCDSLPFTVSVSVNPIPTVAATPSANQTICSGDAITPIALSNPNGVTGTTYSWTRTNNNANLTGIPDGSGTSITGSLTNTTNAAITTVFTITALANGCPSSSTTVSITVNPKPTVAATNTIQNICGNTNITSIVITNPNNVAGTVLSWTRDNTVNVTGIPDGTGATISGALVNTTSTDQVVIFTIRAQSGTCFSTTTATITVKHIPAIAFANANQTICSASAIAAITLSDTNNASGTIYTWTRNNGTVSTGNITGLAANGSGSIGTANLTNTTSSTQITTITVIATGSNGCTSTSTTTITVYPPLVVPVIASSQEICNFQTPSDFYMSTPVTGGSGSYNYQWQYRKTSPQGTWANVPSNGTSATYTPNTNENDYRLIVTDSYCTSKNVTSNAVYINVLGLGGILDSVTISNKPTSPVCNGVISPINAEITHSALSNVKFYWTTNNGYITPASGGPVGNTTGFIIENTKYTFNFTAANTTNAKVITKITVTPQFTNGVGSCNSNSESIDVEILPTPVATATVSPTTICSGSSPGISVKGNITDATTTFNWTRNNFENVTGTGNLTPISSGAIAAGGTYLIPGTLTNITGTIQTVTYYITPVSNGCSGATIIVTITVPPTVTPGTIGANQTICNGDTPAALTENLAAMGLNLTYQWQSSTDNVTYNNISSATGKGYAPSALTQTTWYKRVVTSTLNGVPCTVATTTPVVITINNINPGTIAGTQAVCNGGIPLGFTNASSATGGGTITYQWQVSTTGVDCVTGYSDIVGATGSGYAPSAGVTATTYYRRKETSTLSGKACVAYSNCITVSINNVTAGTIGSNQTICGNNPDAFTEVTSATGSGVLSYQWQSNTTGCGGSWGDIIVNGTSATYDAPPGLLVTTYYRRITTSTLNGVSCTAIGNCVTVTANSVTAGAISGNRTVCSGGNPAPFTETTAATGTGLTYQWKYSLTSGAGPWTNVIGATSATYDAPGPISQTTYYQREVKASVNGTDCYAYSGFVVVYVNDVTPSVIAGSQSVCGSADPVAFTVSTAATAVGTLSYQWQSSTTSASGPWSNIALATNATYDPVPVAQTTYYQVVITSTLNAAQCTAISNSVAVTYNALPVITTQPISQLDCEEASVNFTVVATGTGLTYTWQRKLPTDASFITVIAGGNISFPTPERIRIANVGSAQSPNGTQYQVVITNSSGCSVTSSVATLLVNEITGISPIATAVTQCYGANYSYTVSTSAPPPGAVVSYQWKSSVASGPWNDVVNGTHFSGADTATLNILNGTPAESAEYRVYITFKSSGTNCNVDSHTRTRQITFLPQVTAPVATITQPDCITPTGSVTLSGLPASGTWTLTRSGASSATTTGSGTSTIITGLAPGIYTYTVTLGTCISAPSADIVIQGATTAIWDGTTWTNGPPTINQPLEFTGSYDSLGDLTACSCTVTGGAVVFNPNHTLKITNWVHVNGGSLTFKNHASLVQINNVSNTNSGNILYERETTRITKMDYTYWATPVSPFTLGAVSPMTSGDKMYSYDSSIDDWKQESPSTSMVSGVGYIIRGPQNYVSPMPPSTYKAPFVGVPNNGHYEITGIIADRSYLLGNPYPSALDADSFLDTNQNVLDGTLYFWTHNTPIAVGTPDPGSGLWAYSGNDYASYNRTGGVGTAPAPSSVLPFTGLNDNIPSGKIASGQGFFGGSKVSLTGAKIIFDNAMRVGVGTITGNNSQFFKTKAPKSIEKHRIWLNLTNPQGAFKQTLVGYVTDATNGYEGRFDGESYDGNDFLDFYSVNEDKNLTIQGRALPFDINDEIPLGYRVALDGTFSVAIGQTDGLLSNQPVFIEDKLANSVFNLKEGNYTFTTTAGTFDDRFVLRYTDKTLSTEEPVLKDDGIIVLYSNNYKTLIIRNNVKDATVNSVSLYNMAGQNIANWDVKGREQTSIQIPIKNLPSEIYIVKVKTTKGESSKKIIIK